MGERTTEAIISAMGLSFISLYRVVERLAMFLFQMFIWGWWSPSVFSPSPFSVRGEQTVDAGK
jgi:hypothetical protein